MSFPARCFAAVLSFALIVSGAALVSSPASSSTGGPGSPNWHWVDNQGAAPVLSVSGPFQDIRNFGTHLTGITNSPDGGSQSITSPFPVELNGVTTTSLVARADGAVILDGATDPGVAIWGGDMVATNVNWLVVGTAPNRQLVVHYPKLYPYGNPGQFVDATVTFFEGTAGALVRYNAIGTGLTTDRKIGLYSNYTHYNDALALAYASTTPSAGLDIWYTNAASNSAPTVQPAVKDAAGQLFVSGQPTGTVSLADSGRVRIPLSDGGNSLVDLPFEFTVYGTNHNQVRLGADGVFAFGTGSVPPTGYDLPVDLNQDVGFVFPADLVSQVSTQIRGSAPNRQYIINWKGYRYGDGSAGSQTDVSAVLFENGDRLGYVYTNVPELYQPSSIGISHNYSTRIKIPTVPSDGGSHLLTTDVNDTRTVVADELGTTNVDGFGYRAIKSTAENGPVYDWIDASAGGTQHMTTTDSGTASLTSPFRVSLYGTSSTTINAGSDGSINVGAASSGGSSQAWPNNYETRVITPYYADLVTNLWTTTVGTAPHRKFVVMYDSFRYGTPSLAGDFEIIFSEDTSDVVIQYKDIDDIAVNTNSKAAINKGDGETRLQFASSVKDDFSDASAVRLTLDRIIDVQLDQLRPDGNWYEIDVPTYNPGETTYTDIGFELGLDGIPGLTPADVDVEANTGTWEDVSLSDLGGGSMTTGAFDQESLVDLGPGVDGTQGLRVRFLPGAPTGDLNLTVGLRQNASPAYYAKATSTTEVSVTEPDAPTDAAATVAGTTATVTWTAPESNGGSAITGYRITRSPGNVTSTVGAGVTTADVTGLSVGEGYTFTVAAENGEGFSAESDPSNTVTPAAAPGQPTSVAAVAGNGQATVSWTAAPANGSTITGYTVTSSPGGITASADGNATSVDVTGLTNGVEYDFTVVATNGEGAGSASAASNKVTPTTVPGAVTNVHVVSGNKLAQVDWDAPASSGGSAISSYEVRADPTTAGSDIVVTTGGSAEGATVTGLTNGVTYSVTVKAINSKGAGPASTAIQVIPKAPTSYVGVVLSPTTIKKGKSAFLYGQLSPTLSGKQVKLQRKKGSVWVNVSTVTIKRQAMPKGGTKTGFKFTVRGSTKGKFAYRVYFAGSTTQLPKNSSTKYLTVK